MRSLALLVWIPIFLAAAHGVRAQDTAEPQTPAPQASAPYEARETWCAAYAARVIESTPEEGVRPEDVRATHRMQIELNDCKRDPQTYERQTQAELDADRAPRHEH